MRRLIRLEVAIEAQDCLGMDDDAIRRAVAIAAAQAARKYAVASRTAAHVVIERGPAWRDQVSQSATVATRRN